MLTFEHRYSLRKFAMIESFSTLLHPRLDGTSFWLLSKEAPTFLRVFPLTPWPLGPQWFKMPADFLILTTSVLIIIQERSFGFVLTLNTAILLQNNCIIPSLSPVEVDYLVSFNQYFYPFLGCNSSTINRLRRSNPQNDLRLISNIISRDVFVCVPVQEVYLLKQTM